MNLPRSFVPPRLQTDEGDGDRHATWLELFFDLVFVVAGIAVYEGMPTVSRPVPEGAN